MPHDSIDRFFRATLRLGHLRMLASLARLGQARKVAEAFHVTQSAISKQIAEIEAGLGEAIVRRESHGLVLTPVGHCLAARAGEVLQQLDRARLEIRALGKGLRGRLVVGAVTTVNSSLVSDAICRLRQRAPEVAVALEEDTADRLLPQLHDRRIDVAVVRMWHPVSHAGLEQRLLTDEALVLAVGRRHPLAGRAMVAWQDCASHPWIVPRAGSPARGALEALLASHGVRIPDAPVESISYALNLALLERDSFIGLLPQGLARDWAGEGRIALLPLDTGNLLSEVRAFWRDGDREPTLALMLECLADASGADRQPA